MAKDKMHTVKPETYDSMPMKKVKVFPVFRLGDDDLPELKTMEVGKKYTLVMEVEVKSKSQGSEWSDAETDKQIRASFKVMKVGVESDDAKEAKTKKPSTSKDFETEYAAKRSGGTGSRFDKAS